MCDVKYIVRGSQIAKTVRGALLKTIANKDIVNIIHMAVMNDIQTVLEDDCEELTAYLDDLPTVSEQFGIELETGKWERITPNQLHTVNCWKVLKCSVCNSIRQVDAFDYMDYCPSCGARMVEEK